MGLAECRISISGIRGVVGPGLDVELALQLGAAFAARRAPGPLVLGRDTRVTGPMLRHAVLAGALSRGAHVIDIGIAPTPTVGFACARLNAAGALNLTASHNPAPWNALKLYNHRGLFLNQAEIDQLIDDLNNQRWGQQADWQGIGTLSETREPLEAHLAAALDVAARDIIAARRLRVAIDGCRGAGSEPGPRLLEALGVAVVRLDCIPDGAFTRGLEPIPAHLTQLAEAVRRERCDIGFALDPDADRLAVVDESGAPIGEEYTLALATDYVLSRHERFPGYTPAVVANLSSSRMLDDVAARHGARVIRTPVGEANVVETLLEARAVIGGEGNGGVILPAVHPGRDALTGMALLLQLLAERETTVSHLVAAIPRYEMVKTSAPLNDAPLDAVYAALRDRLPAAAIDDRDGLKLSLPDRWLHVRASNTEPIVRLIAEAPTAADAQALVDLARQLCG